MNSMNHGFTNSGANARMALARNFAALDRASSNLFDAPAALARKVRETVATWQRRGQERRQLLAMTDRDLRDIGLSRLDALAHADKPFWRA